LLVCLAAGFWLALEGGGYAIDGWGAAAVVCLLAFVAAVVIGPGRSLSGWHVSAPLALTGLGGLGLVSIVWAAWPQAALVESGRTLVYAAVMGTAVLAGADERLRRWALVGVGACAALIAAELALRMAFSADPGSLFALGRLVGSIGYSGGTAAVTAIGAWPLAAVACDRARGAPLRAATALGAGGAAAIVIPTESRAALVALVASGLIWILVSPRSLASAWMAVAVGAAIGVEWGALNGAFPAATNAQIQSVGRAVGVVAVAAVAALAVTIVCERWVGGRVGGGAVAWITALVLVAAVVGVGSQLVGSHAKPERWARRQWHAFIYAGNPIGGDTRFDSVGGGRYDLWRVAVIELHRAPLQGVGAGSFGAAYDRLGRSAAQPQQAHSEPLEFLATLGVAGGLLVIAALGLPLAAAVVVRVAEPEGSEQMVMAGLAGGITYFVVQASLDWVWHLFAVGVPAMVLAGAAMAALTPAEARERRRIVSGVVIAAALAVALVVVVPATLAQHYLTASLTAPLAPALVDADRAARFDRLSSRPALARARAELAAGDAQAALDDARQAVAAEPAFWVAWEVENVAAARVGDMATARRAWRRASALAPHSPLSFRGTVPPFS
jgi:hypothetical protein